MSRYTSMMLVLARAAEQANAAPASTVEVLRALGKVEQKHGIQATLAAALSAYVSTVTTLIANDAMRADQAVTQVAERLQHLTEIRDALAAGKPMPDIRMIGAATVEDDVSAVWGKRQGGTA
ncbi:hypothetical protein [Roseomonas genomospecies 6]|uniref:Uncharacterized protein n=1 Tax=Roseomonas genomospecies 6 TaxID=214106 RepID=A0A9W7KR07_9PROT|nr:hypothetical protein [Roseomonas genomospecies 6]KAA0678100.1 hypothetical protein DS843_21190 [Roseomonas genomospecies 6]